MYYNTGMGATKEQWKYGGGERVWAGKYLNSQNLLHWHSDCELIYVERGVLDVTASGATYRINAGDAMFIDSQCLHKINAADGSSLLLTVIFDYGIIEPFASGLSTVSPLLENDYGLPELYGRLMKELTEKPTLYAYETAATVEKLMIDIFRNEKTEHKKAARKTDAKLKALFAEIQAEYRDYTLDDAASFMGMNASYLSRFFAERTGMHFMRYVNSVRIEHAVEMLRRGGSSMTEIADECGFGTIRNFNRIFKLLTGYAPTVLPDDYDFQAAAGETDMRDSNPTLLGCVLVESSSAE